MINYLEYGDFMSAKKLTNASKIVFRENTNFIKLAALSSLGLNQVEEAEHELELRRVVEQTQKSLLPRRCLQLLSFVLP